MEWNGIFGIEPTCIDYQRIAKNEVFAYSNWNGMEWNKKARADVEYRNIFCCIFRK